MGMSVVTYVSALGTYRALSRTTDAMDRSLERLSSGYRINRAADDAAGLGISEGLRSQMTGLAQATRNARDGISVVQTAEGALESVTSILQRMRDLAVQAANDGGMDAGAKRAIQEEIGQLKEELTRIGRTTAFNGTPLLDGSYRRSFQVGANMGETLLVDIGSIGRGVDATGLGVASVDVTGSTSLTATVTPAVSDAEGVPAAGRVALAGDFTTPGVYEASFAGLVGTVTYDGRTFDLNSVDYTGAVTATDYITRLNTAALAFFGTGHTPFTGSATALYFTGATPGAGSTVADAVALTPEYAGRSGATTALSRIDDALGRVSSIRGYLGAVQNRLEHTIDRLHVSRENAMAAVSQIRDTDMALETTAFTRAQILSQAGTAMLSQANRSAQNLLVLLK